MSRCRSCGAVVLWVVTTNGKRMPVDAEEMGGRVAPSPSTSGNVRPTGRRVDGAIEVEVRPDALFDATDEKGFTSHFATCPEASEWRQR